MSIQSEYNLENPALSLKLSKELREISGIAYIDKDQAIAIQDEHAVLYYLSLEDGAISDSIIFGEDGDYEGIAVNDENIFVLRSDGYIFIIPKNPEDHSKIKKVNTFLDNRYDCEGICYNPLTKNLLISCKENPEDAVEPLRNIYNFSLQSEMIEKNPLFNIRLSDIKKYLDNATENSETDELKEYFEDATEDFYYPSDIAVHPKSGDIYICSAKSISILMVIGQDGKLKDMQLIPEEVLPQTEGISFKPNGDLILCSEGKAKEERLFIYTAQ
jgi:uncharacterized protein YjiK